MNTVANKIENSNLLIGDSLQIKIFLNSTQLPLRSLLKTSLDGIINKKTNKTLL